MFQYCGLCSSSEGQPSAAFSDRYRDCFSYIDQNVTPSVTHCAFQSSDEKYVKNTYQWMIPFLHRCENQSPGLANSLFKEYLVTLAKEDLTLPLKIFQNSKPAVSIPPSLCFCWLLGKFLSWNLKIELEMICFRKQTMFFPFLLDSAFVMF